uniref:cytochrome c oxidase subunit II n=1 Tax=Matsucoccus matsumurae TaxID=2259661 RepID=UPI0022FD48F3|nr:cytochrome c oxidase subunit II [Matsucoccus matsumurae]WBG67624.1 cytochrome c oxidase subunit II [Matsucoccus matsumurae]WRQ20334.1 cytochrome c oxidase subunit II [Matsucoccus matsumurae]
MMWMINNYQNFNSFSMEKINMMYEFFMIIMIMISLFIMYMMIILLINNFINKMIMENQYIEIIWTLLPLMLILIMLIPSIKLLYNNNENKNSNLMIKILGNQWFWNYEYLNFNIKFNSYMMMNKKFHFNNLETNNHLILPFNYQIQMISSSLDVIHSWTIPSMNIKMDTIPNQLNSNYMIMMKPNMMFGQCSEICGMNHSFMPIQIESINIKNFNNWMKMY